MKRGYIKLWRMLKDSPCWGAEKFCRQAAWVDLLLMAARKDHWTRVRGIRVQVPAGCVVAAADFLAARWRWSKHKVERWLKELQTDQQIALQKSNIINCIRISNWPKYQEDGLPNGTTDSPAESPANGSTDGLQTARKQPTQENGIELIRIEDNTPLSPPMGGVPVVVPGGEDEPPAEETAGETGTRRRRASSLTGLDLAGRIVRVVFDGMGYNGNDLNDWGLQFDRLMKDRGETAKNLVQFCTWYEERHGEKGVPVLSKPWDLYDKWVALCQASRRDY